MGHRLRDEQRKLAERLRQRGLTWVEIATALRRRWPNLNARAAMRVAHGWSQREVALLWGERWPDQPKSEKDIGLWEIRRPGFATLDKLAQLYQCAIADLISDVGDYRHLDIKSRTTSSLPTRLTAEESGLERREFLAGAMSFAVAAPTTADGDLREDVDRYVGLRSAVERLARLERSSQYATLGIALPRVIHNLEQSENPVPELVSRARAVSAWHLIKRGKSFEATEAAGLSLAAAVESADDVLIAAALRCLSEAHMAGKQYDLARDVAIEASDQVGRSRSSGRGLVVRGAAFLSASMASARSGDRYSATMLLVEAQACADEIGQDLSGEAVFGPSNVLIHKVSVAVELGDAVTALDWADRMSHSLPRGYEEREGRFLIDVARAHAELGQSREALEALRAAEQVAPEEVRTHRLTAPTVRHALSNGHVPLDDSVTAFMGRCGIHDW